MKHTPIVAGPKWRGPWSMDCERAGCRGNCAATFVVEGMEIIVYRGQDGRLVIDLDTGGLDDRDGGEGVPDIRVYVNAARVYDKNWKERAP